jgi:hypothetical protein
MDAASNEAVERSDDLCNNLTNSQYLAHVHKTLSDVINKSTDHFVSMIMRQTMFLSLFLKLLKESYINCYFILAHIKVVPQKRL